MSFGLTSVKAKPAKPQQFGIHEGSFGVPDFFTSGLASAKSTLEASHPLEYSENNQKKNVDRMNMSLLRNTQGLHAPLRISMELKAAKKVGRLPFLASSNVMHDVLTGRDLEVGPEDIFNTAEFLEVSAQPHAVVEKSLGLM